ncbi:MAG TPA: hypothetical protein VMU65_01055 [Candidatus Saccharimonadales bacterium]|nr:hypothetical protein [Candidatus Saccharimonadales bacterium]
MYLSAADITQLPLAAALIDCDGAVLTHTPEWQGPGLGTIAYRLPVTTLLVALDPPDQDLASLMTELIGTIRAAASGPGVDEQRRLRLEVLATGLALVAGAAPLSGGTTDDVLERLTAVLAMISSYPLTVVRHRRCSVPDADLLALALRQLVINARRHDDATAVELAIDEGPTFTLEWEGAPTAGGIVSARHVADRDRWGLGFVRLACDALGATYLAPLAVDGGTRVTAVLGLDRGPRLLLPLALVRDGIVAQASPAWDEETHAPPGKPLPTRWDQLASAAGAAPGRIVADSSGCARGNGADLWLAIPPHSTADRARDLVLGLQHEHDLLDAPMRLATHIQGLTCLIAMLMGEPVPLITPEDFDREYAQACAALSLPPLDAPFAGERAPDASLVALLAERFGGPVRNVGGCVQVVVDGAHRSDPLARRLAGRDGVVNLP